MRITFICGFPFPIGYSGTNRLLSLSRGLAELGNEVNVRILSPSENKKQIVNKKGKGSYLGVNYCYPYNRTYKFSNKILNKVDIFVSILYSFIKIMFSIRKEQIVIISSDEPWLVYLFSKYKSFNKNLKLFYIVDEYPPEMRYKGKKTLSKLSSILFKYGLKKYEGLISMTETLVNFYKNFYSNNNILIVPITVENDRFTGVISKKNIDEYIAYIGNFDNSKDGLDYLIKSFKIVSKKYPLLKLFLGGEGKKRDLDYLRDIVSKLNLADKVKFLGKIHRDDVPDFLKGAKVLAMSRPLSQRNNGGFPTKLGEYLSTGVPVVVTSIGDIPIYLKNDIDIFLSKPNDKMDFAINLLKVLDDYKNALKVAESGKKVAFENFNYQVQAKRISEFISKEN